jgi:hypothetical protein
MRKVLIAMLTVVTLGLGLAPAFAATNTSCNSVPKSEWAQCIIDQAAEAGTQ